MICFNLLAMNDGKWNKVNMHFIDSSTYYKGSKNKQRKCNLSLAYSASLFLHLRLPAFVTIVTGLIMMHRTISNYSRCQHKN